MSQLQKSCISIVQSINKPEIQDLELKLNDLTVQMEQYAKEGKYILAEDCRVNVEKLKKDIDDKRVVDVQRKQKKENRGVKKYLKAQLQQFNEEWDKKLQNHKIDGDKQVEELKDKQFKELDAEKTTLQKDIPIKWKQSSECLNLRKIEENLAKQHNFIEAHKVQKQVKELEKKEEEAWGKQRIEKIEIGLQLLKSKQSIEMCALKKRLQSGLKELELERVKAEAKLMLKHSNLDKDLKSQNKKEELATRGEFKSRANILSPSTKSRIIISTTR